MDSSHYKSACSDVIDPMGQGNFDKDIKKFRRKQKVIIEDSDEDLITEDEDSFDPLS